MELPHSRYYGALAIVFVLALGLRVGATAYFQGLAAPPNGEANPDQIDYELLGFRLSTGAGYTWADGEPTGSWPPGTSFALVPIYAVFGRSFLLARLWFCLISAATCLATAWLTGQAFGSRRVALLAAAWLAVYPGHFYYAMHFLSEVPFDFWLTLAMGCGVAALQQRGLRWDLAGGACWGLAVLTRPSILPSVAVGWFLALLAVRKTRLPLLHVALQAGVLLLVIAPWVARNAVVLGKPDITTVAGGYSFWGSHNERIWHDPQACGYWIKTSEIRDAAHPLIGTETEREAMAWQYGMAFVREHWTDMPLLEALKLWRFLGPALPTTNRVVWWSFTLGWFLTAPAVLAGVVLALRKQFAVALALAVPFLGTLGSVLVFCGCDRYRDALAPIFLSFAALAVTTLVRSLFSRDGQRSGGFALRRTSRLNHVEASS